LFLYIDPLKQGLKQEREIVFLKGDMKFLYIDPLKQGLKQLTMLDLDIDPDSFYT